MARPIDLAVNIIGGSNTGIKSINNLSSSLSGVSVSALRANLSFTNMAGTLLRTVGPYAAAALGIAGIGSAFKKSIDEAIDFENKLNSLNVALASNNNYSEAASKQLENLSSEMQRITKYSDGQILASEALIASLTKLNTDGIAKATVSAANLASALNMDLQSASRLVSQALEGNVGALSRYGVKIQNTTDSTTRYSNVLNALSRFQGRAAAEAETFGGSMEKLKNNIGDVFKNFGRGVIASGELAKVISELSAWFAELSTTITNNIPATANFISGVVRFFKIIGLTVTLVISTMAIAANAIKILFYGLLGSIEKAINELDRLQSKITGKRFAGGEYWTDKFNDSLNETTLTINEASKDYQDYFKLLSKPLEANLKPLKPDNIIPDSTLDSVKNKISDMWLSAINEASAAFKDIDFNFDFNKLFQKDNWQGLFTDLGEGFSNLIKKSIEEGKSAVGALGAFTFKSLKGGEEGASAMLSGIATAVGTALGGPLVGQIAEPLIDLLSMSSEELKNTLKSLFDAIPQLIENIVENIPLIVEALITGIVDSFIRISENLDVIIERFTTNFANAVPRIIVAFIAKIPLVMASLSAQIPTIATRFSVELIAQIPNMANTFVKELVNSLKQQVKGIFGGGEDSGGAGGTIKRVAIGVATGGLSEAYRATKKIFKFAEGGQIVQVPSGYNNDTFPASLSSGELVVDRSLTSQLSDFLSGDNSGGNNNTALYGLLNKVITLLENPTTVSVESKIDREVLASQMLVISRTGLRTT